MADAKVLNRNQANEFFQQPGVNPTLGVAPNLSNFVKQTGVKASGLNDFLKNLDGQLSYYTERSAVERLGKLFKV